MSAHRKHGLARWNPTPAQRRWLYGIGGAVVPILVVYGVTSAEEGALWLAVLGAALVPAGAGLAAGNTPSRRSPRSGPDSAGGRVS